MLTERTTLKQAEPQRSVPVRPNLSFRVAQAGIAAALLFSACSGEPVADVSESLRKGLPDPTPEVAAKAPIPEVFIAKSITPITSPVETANIPTTILPITNSRFESETLVIEADDNARAVNLGAVIEVKRESIETSPKYNSQVRVNGSAVENLEQEQEMLRTTKNLSVAKAGANEEVLYASNSESELEISETPSMSEEPLVAPHVFTKEDFTNLIYTNSDAVLPFIKLDPSCGYEEVTAWVLIAAKFYSFSQTYSIVDSRSLINHQHIFIASLSQVQMGVYEAAFPLLPVEELEYVDYLDNQNRACNRLADKHITTYIGPYQNAPVAALTFAIPVAAQQQIAALVQAGNPVYLSVASTAHNGFGLQYLAERDVFSGALPAEAELADLPPAYTVAYNLPATFQALSNQRSFALGFQSSGVGPYSIGNQLLANGHPVLRQEISSTGPSANYTAINNSNMFLTLQKIEVSSDMGLTEPWTEVSGPAIIPPIGPGSDGRIDVSVSDPELEGRAFFRVKYPK